MKQQNFGKKYNRRDFLKTAGIVSMAGLLASCAPANQGSAVQEEAQADSGDALATAPAPETVTIIFGRHDAVDGDTANVTAFQEMFPNIKVEQQQIGEFASQVPALAAAGKLPDVFRSWEAMSLDLARAGLLIDLQPMVDADPAFKPEDFVENWWNWPILDGKRIGIPDVIAPHVCFYNADLFDSKGVEYPDKDNFTWEDFEARSKAITESGDHVYGSETMPIGWTYFHLKMVWQNGGEFYTPDFKKCIIDSPETIEAIQYWADLLLSGDVMPNPSQIVEEGGIGADANLMQAGKIGLQRDGVWVMNNLIQGGFRFNLVPEPSNKRQDTITHGAYNTIPVTSKNVDAAWQWLNFHCSAEGIYNYGVVGKFPGSRKSANLIEPHPWIVDLPFEVNWDVIPQSLDYGHVLPGPANEGEANKVINDALQAIYAGTAKAADLFPQIAPQVTAIVSQV